MEIPNKLSTDKLQYLTRSQKILQLSLNNKIAENSAKINLKHCDHKTDIPETNVDILPSYELGDILSSTCDNDENFQSDEMLNAACDIFLQQVSWINQKSNEESASDILSPVCNNVVILDNSTKNKTIICENHAGIKASDTLENDTWYGNEDVEEKENKNLDDPTFSPNSSEDSNDINQDEISINTSKRKKTLQNNKTRTNKLRRMQGEGYIGYQRSKTGKISMGIRREARKQAQTSTSNLCKKSTKRFCETFSNDERTSILNKFWRNMTWAEKKVYVTSNVEYIPKKRCSVGETSRRSGTYCYYLIAKDSRKLRVCKKMFLGTLGLKEDMVHDWMKSVEHGLNVTLLNTKTRPGLRVNEKKREFLQQFFEMLPKLPSHYCRKETNKLYLEQFFQTKEDLYREYKDYCIREVKQELTVCTAMFKKVFSESNLSLYQPRKDRCDICCGYETKNICEAAYQEHLKKKDLARNEKERDKKIAIAGGNYTFTMDMQAVKISPVLNASALYYKTKLAVHNFTIYNLATHESMNYWWNETEGDLSASTFTNFVIEYLKEKCINKNIPIILYSDGCCYQNRNCILSNALLNYCIQYNVVIEQKYLEKGHTQMECDSVHSLIERKLKNRQIHLPSDYLKITQEARLKPFQLDVNYVTHDFFKDYSKKETWIYNSIRPGKKLTDPTVTNLRHLRYNPEKKIIEYKINFEDELQPLPVRSLKYPSQVQYEPLHKERLKIAVKKWKHLQELKAVLPSDCHTFYDELPH